MKWKEFAMFLSGLDSETPLGRIVAIRSEDDRERVRAMSPEQKRIRSEWRKREFKKHPPKDVNTIYESLQNALKSMAGYTDEKN